MKTEDIKWEELTFSYMPTDYNVRCTYRDGKWGDIEVSDSEYIPMHIAASCLHYGQESFEGLKAFRIEDDQSLQVFEVVIPEQVDTRSLHRIMGERAKRMGLRLSMQHAAIFEAIHRVRVV